ncbi:hypothetical protein [Pontibacillus salipaludis]|uniref:Uncharacterized protein n=1 Tax=Pontibacillus salipaludis TaxID=1697394 RepID=A0ABQ1QCK3_9BACI|nr:hypothetical protein [Pontibacillus salipaludis]GGD23047.1 hypothetical protein GCM10011389_33500 [Pontibacillus salipaludis]
MSDYLVKQLTDKIVRALPKEKKDIYNYVMRMEDDIEKEVATSAEFLDYLRSEAPHKLAAEHFELTLSELLQIMKDVEIDIDQQLTSMMNEVKWVDCTDFFYSASKKNQKVFYVSLPK